MTEISIDQYVNLDERFASYDNDGYYIDSIMIPIMVADNLPYNISFSELKEFVKQVEVSIHQEELNHFCNNLYVLCSLKAYKVEEQEIIKQIMYRNNVFLYEMQQNGKILDSDISNVELKFYTKLKNKYVKTYSFKDRLILTLYKYKLFFIVRWLLAGKHFLKKKLK